MGVKRSEKGDLLKRVAACIIVGLLFLSLFASAFNIQPAKATGTIYIRADGSVDPPTAPIQRNGDIYTLAGDIASVADGIVIQRDNIVFDGAGFWIQGSGSGVGISLSSRKNIVIENTNVRNFKRGIVLDGSLGNTLVGNGITENNWCGIQLRYGSENNVLRNNIMANNTYNFAVYTLPGLTHVKNDVDTSNTVDGKPIYYWVGKSNSAVPLDAGYVALVDCSYITVQNLNIEKNREGILLANTSYSTITENTLTSTAFGIYSMDGIFNNISGNTLIGANDGCGIDVSGGFHEICGNYIANYVLGMECLFPSYSRIVNNTFVGDGLSWVDPDYSYDNVISNNFVNGRPLVYLEGVSDHIVQDAGQVILVNCNRVKVKNLNLSNASIGVDLWRTSSTEISGNNITGNKVLGVSLEYSSNNRISGNKIANNGGDWLSVSVNGAAIQFWELSNNNNVTENYIANNLGGIAFYYGGSLGNKLYHNDFIDNTYWQVDTYEAGSNTWDDGYPSGGNFWSDYASKYPDAKELDSSGIWNTPYVIDANNQDRYPLINPWTPTPTPDFTITASPTTLSVQQGSLGSSTITITSLNGFKQPVQLAVSGVPSGVIATINPQQVTPPADGSTTSTLTVTVSTTTTLGTFPLTITGTSDSLTHKTSISLEIISYYDQLSKIIQQEMGEKMAVTVEGKEYYIVTIKRYIDPLTWEPSDYTFLSHAPDVRKVYTDTNFIPITERQLLEKIGIIDRANNLLKHIGKPDSIQSQIEVINTVFAADKELANADDTAQWAQYIIFTTLDLSIFVELEQPLSIANEISSFFMDQLEHYATPQQFMLEGGRALLEGAKRNYEEAKTMAEGNADGIRDYDVAYNYLNAFYNGHFKMVYGVDAVLPRGRISESPLWDIAGWMPNYILHLGSMLTSHFPILQELVGTVNAAKIESEAVENMDEFRQFINNVNEIPGKVAQMLEDESFPMDFTSALADQDITTLGRWGIVGVDEINVNLACPAELSVYDSNGNVTGVVKGKIRTEIPNSFYYNNTVTILLPNHTCTIEVVGTNTGTYGLKALYVEDKGIISFAAIGLPTSSNAIHQYNVNWAVLSQGEEGVIVRVDSGGDGVFEHTFTSGSVLTRDEFIRQTSPPPPVGGYSVPLERLTTTQSILSYLVMITTLVAVLTLARRNTKKKTRTEPTR